MTNDTTKILEKIAYKHLDIETLETRNSDRLDFYDTSVWSIKAALEEAYKAGRKAGLQAAEDARTTEQASKRLKAHRKAAQEA